MKFNLIEGKYDNDLYPKYITDYQTGKYTLGELRNKYHLNIGTYRQFNKRVRQEIGETRGRVGHNIKYKTIDTKSVCYMKSNAFRNKSKPIKCFYLKYNHKPVFKLGGFYEPNTINIICDIIKEEEEYDTKRL